MVYNATNINKTNNHLSPALTEHKKDTTYDVRCTISSRPTRLVGFFYGASSLKQQSGGKLGHIILYDSELKSLCSFSFVLCA